jgi:hypothetical protein
MMALTEPLARTTTAAPLTSPARRDRDTRIEGLGTSAARPTTTRIRCYTPATAA